ncbi:MAG: GNVR domain-containing protein [Syntrophales bacterium]|nr:GNVR domain-containing protein [Syntrophales bacterium]
MKQKHPSGNMRDFARVIFKYKKRALAAFTVIIAAAAAATFLIPPVYEAKSSVMIKFGREHMYRPEVGEIRPSIILSQDGIINTEMQILTSRDLLQNVIMSIGPDNMYGGLLQVLTPGISPLEAAILQFEKDIKVENKQRSDVIQIAFRHRDPQTAAKAVNLLVEQFKEKHLQVFSGPTSKYLQHQVALYANRLGDAEKNLEEFKKTHGVIALEEQKALLLRQKTDLDTAYKHSQNEVREGEQRIASIRSRGSLEPERQVAIETIKTQLLALQLKEQDLLRKYKDNSQVVQNLRDEIKTVSAFLKKQKGEIGRQESGKIEMELSASKARIGGLARQIERIEEELLLLDSRDREFLALKREVAIQEGNYQTYLKKLEEARISEDLDSQKMANISVVQAAVAPTSPVRPKLEYNLGLGLLFGLLAAFGLAFLSEYSDQSLSTPDSAGKRLGIPVLAAIPYKK